jgi:hypothetical protein
MNNPEISPDNNENSLRTILRAINFSQGQLSLIFLRCNYAKLRQQISTQIHQVSSIPIREITLTASTKSLYNQISQELGNEQPQALMISSLDSVKNIDVILSLSNQIREEFRKNFPFPILIWIDDQILKKIIRVAPDLESWGSILDFENDTEDLINLIRERTEEIFINDHIPSPQVYQEIEFASQDLQNRGAVINPEIQAGLDLAFGLREYQQDHLDHALNYYQKSGEFWQNYNNTPPALSRTLPLLRGGLERYGIILVKISLVYTRKAEINNDEDLENWQNSRNYLQQALEIFEKARRLDLVIQYINDLGEIFRHLKAWNDLENLAQKSLNLSENVETFHGKSVLSQIWLSQNYGFLAEVALENQDYLKANQYAQQAIDILTKIPNLPTQEYSQYRLFISRSQVGLGEISPAIQTLETAKNQSYHQYNPKLYIAILEKLSFLYFQEKQYLKAFNLKQEKLQIEQQYGFRAFVGASYLNPQRQIINTPLPGEQREVENLENTATIAREISASGREQDVKRLRTRIAGTQHKLTVIHGQSGVGKSSILQGGLIPALQKEPIGERDAVPIFLRVYTNWIELLGESLKTETLKSTNDQLSPHSTDTIIQKLRKNADKYLLTVLIFDQFEEFFFVYTDKIQRKPFYDFFRICLDIPFVKIVLSLREDYLHYLLELDRLVDLTVTNNNILDKDIRYYLGNFSPPDATTVIQTLTEKTRFYLQAELITELVKELAGDMGEVRPIELQIVGTQLQTEQITTLAKYREFGNKEKVVEKFLEDVIKDCGSEHEQVARLLLYLLTDENNTRPLKTKDELVVQLPESENLDLVLILNIFVASGLVLLLRESPADRYQLVHDYLVEFIRQQQGNELLAKLAQAQAELQQEKEANQIIETARIKAEAQIKEAQKRLKLSSGLAASLVVIAGMASVYGINQLRETNIARTEKTKLERETQKLKNQTKDLELKSQQAENNKQTAENNLKLARQNLLAAKTKLAQVNKEAESKIKTANDKTKAAQQNTKKAEEDLLAAKTKLEQLNKEAESKIKTANDKTKAAQQNTKKAEEDLLAAKTKLEQLNKEVESKIKTANDKTKAAEQNTKKAEEDLLAAKTKLEQLNKETIIALANQSTPKAKIKIAKTIIDRIKSYKDKYWAIGLNGDTLQPDAFLTFFKARSLPFAFFVRSRVKKVVLGEDSAYEQNIITLNKYIEDIISQESEKCKLKIVQLEDYKKNNRPIGLNGDYQKPDEFIDFFAERDLPFAFYVWNVKGVSPQGNYSAYDQNIATLNNYIKELKAENLL